MYEKWAAIDIGSNTVQLQVAESVGNHFRPCLYCLRTTRLGAMKAPGLLDEARIADTLAVLAEYRDLLTPQGVSRFRVIATSAVRDADNKETLLARAAELTGWQVEVLSGQEEARLSFLGAASPAISAGAESLLLIDIGGSSSELIRWHKGEFNAASANVGAVRALSQGWNAAELERRLAEVFSPQPADSEALVIGVGGSITTAAGLLLGLGQYNRAAIEGYWLTPEGLAGLLDLLMPLSVEERCAFSPLLERRGEVICEGLQIARAFCRLLRLPGFRVSGGGVLDGCLLDWKANG